jgi:glycine hydroxymethyltransferase
MGADEMREIASIIALVLRGTRSAKITKGEKAGQLSKAKYVTDPAVVDEATTRVNTLLGRFLLYPELDLPFLKEHFPLDSAMER